jgi:hypothetical protein
MSREPVRSPARSIANLEFHHKGEAVNEIALRIVERLEEEGVRAVCPSMGFPMEMGRFPERTWVVGHKRHLLEVVKPLQEKPETLVEPSDRTVSR